jgi:hypothetical protein
MIFYPSESRQAYIKMVQAAAKSLKRITFNNVGSQKHDRSIDNIDGLVEDDSFFLVIRRGAAILAPRNLYLPPPVEPTF